MPTGYTSELYDGEQKFVDFVLKAARSRGALIHMRDTSFDAPIRLSQVGSYYTDKLDKLKYEIRKYEYYTENDWKKENRQEYLKRLDRYYEAVQEENARLERYKAMLERVKLWEPPTEEHKPLKEFMINQLKESIDFDTGSASYLKPTEKSWQEYKQEKTESLARELERTSENLADERERVESRNKYILQLIDSLGLDKKDVV